MRRSLRLAIIATAFALLPMSLFGLAGTQDTESIDPQSVKTGADANACFAPAKAPITAFDGDGTAVPAAMWSKNSQPGAPLP